METRRLPSEWLHWLLDALRSSVVKQRSILPADVIPDTPAEERYKYESEGAKANPQIVTRTWRW